MIKRASLQKSILGVLADGEQYSVQEIKMHLAKIDAGEYSEGQFAGSMNTLQRNGTIEKVERGVYALRQDKEEVNMKTCFVVSPIGDEKSETRKKSDQLYKHIIQPVCESCGFIAERVDHMNDVGSIPQLILDNLESADLVIADITGHNPNVFFEMGFRARNKKPMIHMRKHDEPLPFDIASIRALDYDLTDLDSVESTKDRLEKSINGFSYAHSDDSDKNFSDYAYDNIAAQILPIQYQILDAITELQSEVKSNNNNTLETVINTLQKTQPKMSQEDAMIASLLPAMLENPQMLNQLMAFSEKFPTSSHGKKP